MSAVMHHIAGIMSISASVVLSPSSSSSDIALMLRTSLWVIKREHINNKTTTRIEIRQ